MKQALIANESLRLPRGKLAAQAAHAAMAAFLAASSERRLAWLESGMAKVVLRGDSEEHLLELHEKAQAAGLPTYIVRDAGKTVVEPGTITFVGIGPAEADELDSITRDLKLLR
jgi:peptidyl-tRNA hydrolase